MGTQNHGACRELPGHGAGGDSGGDRSLFERSPVSLWVEDLSAVKAWVEKLRRQGVADFVNYFRIHPDEAGTGVRLMRVINVNQATLDLFGATGKGELLGNLDRLLDRDASPLHRFTPNVLCLAAGEERCSGEFAAATLQGKRLQLGYSWNVADGDTATYGHVYYSLFDITRRKEAEDDRARMAEQIRHAEKMESIGALVGGLAHDFNNMLTAIMGSTELLRGLVPPESEASQYVDNIESASQRASALVRHLLSLARRDDVQPVQVDSHTVIRAVHNLLSHSLGPRIHLSLRLDAESPRILATQTQLEAALLNLGLNARDAMPNGGSLTFATRSVTPSPAPDGGSPQATSGPCVEISVSDTGIGMSPEVRRRLFEPFFTTKPKGQGTGLGLTGVREFVNNHHGAVQVETEEGKGTTFTLVLPVAPPVPPAEVAPSPAPARVSRGGQILIVEDETLVRNIGSRAVQSLGYTVSACQNGEEALRWLREHAKEEVVLVILDMDMPGLRGDEVFREMRSLRPAIRVLLVSGYGRKSVIDRLLAQGAAGFLAKPFGGEELTRHVERCLARISPSAGSARNPT